MAKVDASIRIRTLAPDRFPKRPLDNPLHARIGLPYTNVEKHIYVGTTDASVSGWTMRLMQGLRREGVRRTLYAAWLILGTAFLYEQYRIVTVWRTSPTPIPLDVSGVALGIAICLLLIYVGFGAWFPGRGRRQLARWLPVVVVPVSVFLVLVYAHTMTLLELVLAGSVVAFSSLSFVSMAGDE